MVHGLAPSDLDLDDPVVLGGARGQGGPQAGVFVGERGDDLASFGESGFPKSEQVSAFAREKKGPGLD